MAVEVIMPQMGESIFEGTITKWLKKPGDTVDRDEPLFEISTDKVDAEIPSPTAGVLKEIRVEEGKTVPIQTVVALIDAAGAQPAAAKPAATRPSEAPAKPAAPPKAQAPPPQGSQKAAPRPGAVPPPPASAPVPERNAPEAAAAEEGEEETVTADGKRIRSSPLVRRLARENGIDLGTITGTGAGGRISKKDVLAAISNGPEQPAAEPPAKPTGPSGTPPVQASPAHVSTEASAPGTHLFRPLRSAAHDRNAAAHRRTHGAFQAGLAARLFHRRSRHDPHCARARSGALRIRAEAPDEAHLHALLYARLRGRPARLPHGQRFRGRHKCGASRRDQHWHCCGP